MRRERRCDSRDLRCVARVMFEDRRACRWDWVDAWEWWVEERAERREGLVRSGWRSVVLLV